jgi:hypothetical protein
MFRKGLLGLTVAALSMPLMADEKSFENSYFMTGVTLSKAQEQTVQGINLEYNWVDYNEHYTDHSHKHQLNGFGIKFNTDDTKFDNEYSDVRELGLYGKRGFELKEESNFYGLVSAGIGLVETSKPKAKSDSNEAESGDESSADSLAVNGAVDDFIDNPDEGDGEIPANPNPDLDNDENDGGGDFTTGNPNTDEKISLSAEIGLGIGYYSREGNYAASVEVLGQYYEKGDFDPALRVMFGWRF